MSIPLVIGASTFVEVLILLFVFIPLVLLWVFALADLFGRPDLGGWSKAIWLLVIIIIPILGALIYIGTRPAYAE
jgi:uncharacterized RDD family membrane protein YckC